MNELILLVTGAYFDAGYIGLFGGVVNHFYFLDKHKIKFKIGVLLTTSAVSFFVGMVAYFFLPVSAERPGYLLLCGFFAYKIIDVADNNSTKLIKKLVKKFGA